MQVCAVNPNNPVYLDELTRLGVINMAGVLQPVSEPKRFDYPRNIVIPQHILDHRDEMITILSTVYIPVIATKIIQFYGW